MNRLQFLRGNYKGEQPLRPPWSQAEHVFTDVCDRCDECIRVCHARLIEAGGSGFPVMNFSRAGCDFCRACVDACPTGAIQIDKDNQHMPWQSQAVISDQCFSERGIVCRSCGEVCEVHAIRFRLAVGGAALIELNSSVCNGCGECVSICPANAIQVKPVQCEQHSEAQS